MTRPILLGNAPSTGSSLLSVLLQRHPSIAGRGEITILDKPGLYEESPGSFQKHIGRWLDLGYPEVYFGGGADLFVQLDQYPWTREALREFCLSCDSFPEMIKGFFAHNSRVWGRPQMAGEDSTEYLLLPSDPGHIPGRPIHSDRKGRP